jgi:hypothetical protein
MISTQEENKGKQNKNKTLKLETKFFKKLGT